MTDGPEYILTRAGYEQLQRELADYQERRARQQGELADVQHNSDENFQEEAAEFEAHTMREWMDERIGNLERILRDAQVVEDDPNPHTIDPGDRVTLDNLTDKERVTYDLISSAEVQYGREGVSIESPVGAALLGKRKGQVIEVETPDGVVRYAIRKIERIPGVDEVTPPDATAAADRDEPATDI